MRAGAVLNIIYTMRVRAGAGQKVAGVCGCGREIQSRADLYPVRHGTYNIIHVLVLIQSPVCYV